MATKTLIDKIEALPPEKKARVEDFIDSISEAGPTKELAFPRELLDRIDARREELLREHGRFPDSTETIRELRENGS